MARGIDYFFQPFETFSVFSSFVLRESRQLIKILKGSGLILILFRVVRLVVEKYFSRVFITSETRLVVWVFFPIIDNAQFCLF